MLLPERHPDIYFHSDTAYSSCGRERQRLLCSGNLVTIRIYFLGGKGLAEDNEEQGTVLQLTVLKSACINAVLWTMQASGQR